MIDTVRIEGTRPANDTVDFVAFRKQERGEIGTILAGDSSDKSFTHGKDYCETLLPVFADGPNSWRIYFLNNRSKASRASLGVRGATL
jgi:hypothetical protein